MSLSAPRGTVIAHTLQRWPTILIVLAACAGVAGTILWLDANPFWIALWVLCLGAFAFPLVYLRDTHDEFVLPKLLFAHLLLVTLLALRAVRWARAGELVIRRTPLDLPILAFLGSALIATVFSINRNVALFGGCRSRMVRCSAC